MQAINYKDFVKIDQNIITVSEQEKNLPFLLDLHKLLELQVTRY